VTISFQGKDGVLNLMDFGNNGTSYRLEVLFCEMDFTGPTTRPRTEESLVMNRGNFDTNAHYIEGNDDPRYAPVPISFSARLADTTNTHDLSDWISGSTVVSGKQLYSYKGKTTIDGNTLPTFVDTANKYAYRVEMVWWGTASGNTYGLRYEEVYFPPGEQTISESADGLILSCNGQVYGDVTAITTTNYAAWTDVTA